MADELGARDSIVHWPELSPSLLTQVVARLPVPIAVVDRNLRIRFANRRFCDQVGLSSQEILDRPVDDCVAGIGPDEFLHRCYEQCFTGGSPSGETWVSYRERGVRSVVAGFEPIGESGGIATHVLVTLQDVTEHCQAKHANARLERALKTVTDCIRVVTTGTDESTMLREVCRIAVDTGGYRMAWVGAIGRGPGKPIVPIASAGDDGAYLDSICVSWGDEVPEGRGPTGRAVRQKKPVVATNLLTEPGYQPWLNSALGRGFRSTAAFPLLDGDDLWGVLSLYAGDPDAFDAREVGLLGRLAESVALGMAALRARTEREQLRQQLVFADRMTAMGRLAAGVAHEINTPLAYVIASLDLVLRDFVQATDDSSREGRARLLERLRQAREGSERVRVIARDLRVFSRRDEPTTQQLTDVREVLEASVRMAWSEIKYRAQLVQQVERVPPVQAEPARLGQVFLNLLINAAQAIPAGSANENRISLAARREDANVVVLVTDTGCGISPENAARVFEPFFTTKPVGIGTGLGLCIARDIVRALGGSITFESSPGRGTTVRVSLPVADETSVGEAIERAPATQSRCQGPGRLLVIDDDDGIREVIADALSDHDVRMAENGTAAMGRIFAGQRFDVILCDMMMPQMTGMQFHRQVAAIDPRQAERIVFMSGGAFTPEARDFLAAIPNATIEKPFDLAALRRVVAYCLSTEPRPSAAQGAG